MAVKLHLGMSTQQILDKHRNDSLETFIMKNNMFSRAAALSRFLDSDLPRDFYLKYSDIANIKQRLDDRSWRHSPNQQR